MSILTGSRKKRKIILAPPAEQQDEKIFRNDIARELQYVAQITDEDPSLRVTSVQFTYLGKPQGIRLISRLKGFGTIKYGPQEERNVIIVDSDITVYKDDKWVHVRFSSKTEFKKIADHDPQTLIKRKTVGLKGKSKRLQPYWISFLAKRFVRIGVS